MRYWGAMNQSEFGAPMAGSQGIALRSAVAGGRVVQTRAPVAAPTYKYRNLVGSVVARPASNRYVFAPTGYGGLLPLGEQPLLRKPNPWSDPTRGAP